MNEKIISRSWAFLFAEKQKVRLSQLAFIFLLAEALDDG